MNNRWVIKVSLFINYFVFAALLNSVGILVQKSQNVYGVSEIEASQLEPFKDLSIAFISFFIGSFLPRLGYKKAILFSLALVFLGCLGMYFGNSFWAVKILFACTGISFGIVKVSVLALIGYVTDNEKEHNSFMSIIESVFMLGITFAYLVFPLFYSDTDPDAWLRVYLLLAGLIAFVFIILFFSKFKLEKPPLNASLQEDLQNMLSLLKRPLIILFAAFAFLYVMTEQGIMSWLPTFNQKVLKLPETTSVQMAVILMLSFALGRFLTSHIVKKVTWFKLVSICLVLAAALVLFILPKAQNITGVTIESIQDVPMIAFVFPLIGLFLAPIYPLVNSTVLSTTEKKFHSAMAGLLTFFSAIGGTLGSISIGWLFAQIGGEKAFYFALIPLSFLLIILFLMNKQITSKNH